MAISTLEAFKQWKKSQQVNAVVCDFRPTTNVRPTECVNADVHESADLDASASGKQLKLTKELECKSHENCLILLHLIVYTVADC